MSKYGGGGLSANGQQKSSNFMFTFSTADEEAIKRAGENFKN